jgi:hypothetical protein
VCESLLLADTTHTIQDAVMRCIPSVRSPEEEGREPGTRQMCGRVCAWRTRDRPIPVRFSKKRIAREPPQWDNCVRAGA